MLRVPYPILLVLGGLALGFVPGIPHVALRPDVVLVAILPPLLYSSAFFTSLRDLRRNIRPLSLLAVGLVFTTTVAVAAGCHAAISGLSWPVCFVLGAVVAPADAVAATAIAERLALPRRLVALIEGESLINDATALVAYRFAVVAVLTGSFSLWHASWRFVVDVAGGVAIGLAVGFVLRQIRRRLNHSPTEIAIALLFGLVGLQLRPILDSLSGRSTGTLIADAVIVSAAVIVIRLLWVYPATYLPRLLSRRIRERDPYPPWQWPTLIGWTGLRGAVTLAAALALPLTTRSGAPFPERAFLIYLAFCVILATLVLQGLSLPLVIRLLHLEDDGSAAKEETKARIYAADAALARLEELVGEDWVREDTAERLRGLYGFRQSRFSARFDADDDGAIEQRSQNYQRLRRELLDAERQAVVQLRGQGKINDDVMNIVQRDLDLEDARLDV